jgi:hypothetical protein
MFLRALDVLHDVALAQVSEVERFAFVVDVGTTTVASYCHGSSLAS